MLTGANILLLFNTIGNNLVDNDDNGDKFGNWIHSIEVFKKILSPIDNNLGDNVNDFNDIHPSSSSSI